MKEVAKFSLFEITFVRLLTSCHGQHAVCRQITTKIPDLYFVIWLLDTFFELRKHSGGKKIRSLKIFWKRKYEPNGMYVKCSPRNPLRLMNFSLKGMYKKRQVAYPCGGKRGEKGGTLITMMNSFF